MHASDEAMNEMMKHAAEILNIKPHMAGLSSSERKLLFSAADVEGHKGEDERYYLVDFSRTFPCVKPEKTDGTMKKGLNLTSLFRPEFVKKFVAAFSVFPIVHRVRRDGEREFRPLPLVFACDIVYDYVLAFH